MPAPRSVVWNRLFTLVMAVMIAAPLVMASPQHAVAAPGYAAIPVSAGSGEKPQSKVWQHADTWWAVFPSTAANPAGTWLWRMNPDETWSPSLLLSASTDTKADVKIVGDVAHVLLYGASPELISIEYSGDGYQAWSERSTATSIPLSGSETATLDVDSTGRMWLASETSSTIVAYYSDSPYSSFSGPVTLASGINGDDIGVVVALPHEDEIGVLWSNQDTKRFGFRTHSDGDDPGTWSVDELPASQSANDAVGTGMADDHLNVAVASDGTLYAAVKTGWDTTGYAKIALLVRRPNGAWDPLYPVDDQGTRGIVLLNEVDQTVRVVYTSSEGYHDIVMKTSPLSTISFGSRETLMTGGLNDATSTKDEWTDRILVMAASATEAQGTFISTDPSTTGNLRGWWRMEEGSGTTLSDASGLANDGSIEGSPTWVAGQDGSALHFNGSTDDVLVPDAASLDITDQLTVAAWVRPEKTGTQYLVKKATQGGTDGYELSLASPGTVFFRLNQASSANTYRIDSTDPYPTDGTWIHVAATYDGTTMRLYVNGVEQGSGIPGPASIAANALPLAIAAQSDAASKFQGTLDDIRVYARALSVTEVEVLAGVTPANHAPLAAADSYTTHPESALNVGAPGLLANDTDADGDSLTAVLDTDVSHGSLTVNTDGSFAYTPAGGWVGTDTFTYHANDGADNSNQANVSITTAGDLRGWWPMEEGSGSTVGDSSGLGNDGTIEGSPTWVAGRHGTALHFNGSSDDVVVPDDASLDITDQLTIAAWVQPEKFATQTIASKAANGATDGYELTLATTKADDSSQRVFFRLNQDANGDTYRINATDPYPIDGTWVHVAATYDGTTMRLYVNGVEQGTGVTGPSSIAANELPLAIGGQPGRYLQGALDDVRVYARALSAADIVELADHAPVLAAVGDQTVVGGAVESVAMSASDADGDALAFALAAGAPSWASVADAGDGTASLDLAPASTDGGSYNLTVTVTDGLLSDSETFAVDVTDAAVAPAAPTGVSAAAGYGSALVGWSAPADDGGSSILGYTVTSSPGARTCTTGGALSCTVGGLTNGTTYTFSVVARNAVGSGPSSMASLAVVPGATPFTDISTSTFRDDISWLSFSGITTGCSPTSFCPDADVTRGQMAAFLVRALSLPASSTDYFTDDNGTTFEHDINALAASGITKGCSPTSFCPDADVTRGQMAAFLVRALALPASSTDYFADDNGTTFEHDINALAATGITKGCSPTTFCPDDPVTRGQMAAFLHRALG